MAIETENLVRWTDIERVLNIKHHMFVLWVRMGLIPAPQPLVRLEAVNRGRGYPPEAFGLCRKIKAWRELGISYRDIRARLEAEKVKV